jgi:hypothetical protein
MRQKKRGFIPRRTGAEKNWGREELGNDAFRVIEALGAIDLGVMIRYRNCKAKEAEESWPADLNLSPVLRLDILIPL